MNEKWNHDTDNPFCCIFLKKNGNTQKNGFESFAIDSDLNQEKVDNFIYFGYFPPSAFQILKTRMIARSVFRAKTICKSF